MRTRVVLTLGVCLFCAGSVPPIYADLKPRFVEAVSLIDSPTNWHTVNAKLSQELMQVDLGQLAKQTLAAPKPQTAEAWLRALAILARAEYRNATQKFLGSRPAFMQGWNFAIHVLVSESNAVGDLELARRLCELFPEQTDRSDWFAAWANQTPPEKVDQWLAARAKTGVTHWLRLRLKYRAEKNTEQPLLEEFAARVRKHPESDVAVTDFLAAVDATGKKQNIEWLAETVRFRLAAPLYFLSRRLHHSPQAILTLLERARVIPFTHAEVNWYREYIRRNKFAYLPLNDVLTEEQLSQWIDAGLMDAYQRAGQADKAQALLEKLTKANPNGLPTAFQAFNAGQIQAGSGARVIEQRILQAEIEQDNTPQYWLKRAEYYAGRKEEKQAIEAYEKALSLAPIKNDFSDAVRTQVLSVYARLLWLKNVEMPTEAFALLRRELKLAPTDSDYARSIVTEMLYFDNNTRRLIAGDDVDLWRFALAQKDLARTTSLLHVLLERTPKANQETRFTQIEETIVSRSPENFQIWGDSLLQLREPKRAMVWLQKARDTKPDDYHRSLIIGSLWRAYEMLSDWRGMETLLSEQKEIGISYAQLFMNIAVAAAQSGKRETAIKYFRLWANQDRRLAPNFYPLPAHGLSDVINACYFNMAQQEPESETPRRVKKTTGFGAVAVLPSKP
jgi:tetratricopeptide (TPR) repeat protein